VAISEGVVKVIPIATDKVSNDEKVPSVYDMV